MGHPLYAPVRGSLGVLCEGSEPVLGGGVGAVIPMSAGHGVAVRYLRQLQHPQVILPFPLLLLCLLPSHHCCCFMLSVVLLNSANHHVWERLTNFLSFSLRKHAKPLPLLQLAVPQPAFSSPYLSPASLSQVFVPSSRSRLKGCLCFGR